MIPENFTVQISPDYKLFSLEDEGKNGTFNIVIIYAPGEILHSYNLALIVMNPETNQWDDSLYTNNHNAIKIFRTVAWSLNLVYGKYANAKVFFYGL